MTIDNVKKNSGSIPSSEGLPVYYDLYQPEQTEDSELPVILFLHGFKGFKDWGAFPEACAELSKAGFAVVAMNFSLNGVGESMLEFDELERFSRETLSQDLNDVGTVISAIRKGEITGENISLDSDTIGVLGHSRGGHTAVAAAAEYSEIKCLVTWSAVADYNARWSYEMISDWENDGVTEIKNGRTGQMMPVKKVVYDDARENADRVIALNRADELKAPALFVHAKGDDAVSYKEAEKLHKKCSSDVKKLLLIPDSGHTFDTSHPFEEDEFPESFERVLDETEEWFTENLK